MTRFIPILFVWLWSTGFVGAKYGLPYIEPFWMLALRFAAACLLLCALAALLRERRMSRTQLTQQMCVGVLLHGVYLGGVFFAIDGGLAAGVAAIIVGLQPIVTAIIGRLFLSERLGLAQRMGLGLGFVGVGLVVAGRYDASAALTDGAGIAACGLAVLAISAGTVLQKRVGAGVALVPGSAAQFLGAALLTGALSFAFERQEVTWSLPLALSMIWLIFGLSIIAIFLLMIMIREGEVARVSSYFYLVPPVTVLETWLLFDERLSLMSVLGCALSVLGVFLVVRAKA